MFACRLATTVVLLSLCLLRSLAQSGAGVAGFGNTLPTPYYVAPGMLITIYVKGIGGNVTGLVQATSTPLPTTLAGISISMKQRWSPQGPTPVPLLAVFPVPACVWPEFAPCGSMIGINLQLPFELVPDPGPPFDYNTAQLTVSDQAGGQAMVEANPIEDRIHVLRNGDTLRVPERPSIGLPFGDSTNDSPVVTHPDGTPLSQRPRPGETVVIWAVGLGYAQPVASTPATGHVTPSPAPQIGAVNIRFDWNVNGEIEPNKPYSNDVPAFVGMSPGSVGLYQINFVIPSPPPGYPNVGCPQYKGRNLTVSIGRYRTFDGAKICVDLSPRP